MPILRPGLLLVSAALAAFALSVPQAAMAQQGGPMPVTVSKPVMRKVVETADFTGRFQAWPTVNVTSRVTGYLDSASFVEGGLVKQGDTLFTIDPRSLQSAVDQAQAQAKIAQTKLDLASTNFKRSEELKRSGNVTDAVYQSNQQAFFEAQASIDAANAAVASSKLDLEFSTIKAPIAGRIGRKLVSPGNLIVANGTNPLTTIVSVDPIFFYFDLDEASYLAFRRANPSAATDSKAPTKVSRIALSDEKTFSREGTLDYLDTQVDTSTGTVTARAKVTNADGFLTPGLFGRVRVPVGEPFDALVVPEVAVGRSAQGSYVMVVAADGTVNLRPVEPGPKFGSFRVIRSGLTAEDQVLVNGQMRARPGGKVVPQLAPLDVPQDLGADASH